MQNLLRRLLLGAAILFASVYSSAQSPTVISQAYNETFHTAQVTVAEEGFCSATAIGPLALLTATHCELGTDEITLQGKGGSPDVDLKIDRRVRDGYDHTILYVSPTYLAGYTFTNVATVEPDYRAALGQGVFVIGNPHGFSEIFRKGYIAGAESYDNGGESIPEILVDIHVGPGDSGAAIFDEFGNVIGVVAGIEVHGDAADVADQYRMPYALSLNFTVGQLKEAASYGAKK
jgi:hypothetical protein